MKKKIACITTAAVIVLSVLSYMTVSPASGGRQLNKGKEPFKKGTRNAFALSGTYTGGIGDQIVLHGKTYFVDKNTIFYVIGEDEGSNGSYARKADIYISGVIMNGVPVVKMAIIRQPASILDSMEKGRKLPKHGTPSESNPNVGILDAKAPE